MFEGTFTAGCGLVSGKMVAPGVRGCVLVGFPSFNVCGGVSGLRRGGLEVRSALLGRLFWVVVLICA